MKIALINDTHAGARGDSTIFNEFFFRFWENTFFPYLKDNNITTICHLGDVVDRRKFINFVILNSWRSRFFDYLKDNNITMHVMVGNHDVTFKNSNELNAMQELFSDYDNIHTYIEPLDYDFDGLQIAMVPWINSENYEQSMKFLEETKSQVVFGHFEIAGFEMDRGNIAHTGLSREIFNRFDMVMSGHFHHKSQGGPIYYLGNQYEMTWADYGDVRGFHVFDTDTRELEFIPNPNRIFYKISYDDTVEQATEYWTKQFDYSKYKDTYLKLVVVTKQDPYLFDLMLDAFYKAGVLDISIIEDFNDSANENIDDVDESEDTITILNKFVDNMKLDVDNNTLKSYMREIYVEAVNAQKTE